jgi:hypothetical protein
MIALRPAIFDTAQAYVKDMMEARPSGIMATAHTNAIDTESTALRPVSKNATQKVMTAHTMTKQAM